MTIVAFTTSCPVSRLPPRSFATSTTLRPHLNHRLPPPRRRQNATIYMNAPDNVALIAPPPAAFQAAATLGGGKAALKTLPIIVLGMAAGAYLAIGGLLALSVGGSAPALAAANPGLQKFLFGALGLPVGLTLVVATGAELFLGNCMLLTAAALAGKTTWRRAAVHWALAWAANFAGALVVLAMVLAADAVGPAAAATAAKLALAKIAHPPAVMFMRGVLCNWLVCLGVYLATACRDFLSKFAAVFCVVSTFVTLGFDNCIANMFFIPLGIVCGADVSVQAFFFRNLIPVTFGNLVGGALLVGCLYFVGYGMAAAAKNSPKPTQPTVKLAVD